MKNCIHISYGNKDKHLQAHYTVSGLSFARESMGKNAKHQLARSKKRARPHYSRLAVFPLPAVLSRSLLASHVLITWFALVPKDFRAKERLLPVYGWIEEFWLSQRATCEEGHLSIAILPPKRKKLHGFHGILTGQSFVAQNACAVTKGGIFARQAGAVLLATQSYHLLFYLQSNWTLIMLSIICVGDDNKRETAVVQFAIRFHLNRFIVWDEPNQSQ